MPYTGWEDVNPAIKGIKPPVTLAQANMIARWADSIEEKGEMDSPWAGAIALFKRTHHVEGGKWVPNKGSKAEHSDEPSPEEMEQALDALVKALLEAGFESITSEDLHSEDVIDAFLRDLGYDPDEVGARMQAAAEQALERAGEPAYVIDLLSALPVVDGKPDFSQPFRILPQGDIYRYGQHRMVTVEDIDQFEDNWRHRAKRGIRRSRIIVDAEHETGGIGWYTEIFSQGTDGLWARIALSTNGRKLLSQRDFHYFSPTVAWKSQDRVTGERINNQIVGGALTNYPVFGDDTALPTLGYSEAALHRMLAEGHDMSQYAVTKAGSDGKDYPASAWLLVGDPQHPTTWHLRVKEYVNGKLQYTKNMVSKAAQAVGSKGFRGRKLQVSADEIAEAKRKLRGLYLKTLKVPKEQVPQHLFSEKGGAMTAELTTEDRNLLQQAIDLFSGLIPMKGGGTMSNGDKDKHQTIEVTAEQFAEMQTQLTKLGEQVEALSTERDQLKQQVTQSHEQLAAETHVRILGEMRQHAETFSHLALPVELADGAPEGSLTAQEHFAWLKAADDTEGQVHWAFFNSVLKAANAALVEAAQYSELGTSVSQDLTEDEVLHRKATAYAKEHEVDYLSALKAVARGTEPGSAA